MNDSTNIIDSHREFDNLMFTQLNAFESVDIYIPPKSIPIQQYLHQPKRLINALADSSRIQSLSNNVFRLHMRPLVFVSLKIQPTVDIKVWTASDGTIYLHSIGCEIVGVDYINHRFNLDLKGHLSPYSFKDIIRLQGNANLQVDVELPGPFSFAPKAILETAGNSLLKSILLTIKKRLLHQLVVDYCLWVKVQTQESHFTLNTQELSI